MQPVLIYTTGGEITGRYNSVNFKYGFGDNALPQSPLTDMREICRIRTPDKKKPLVEQINVLYQRFLLDCTYFTGS